MIIAVMMEMITMKIMMMMKIIRKKIKEKIIKKYMTLKYLLVLGRPEANRQIAFLHVPIDNIVIQTASEHVKPCRKPWSQWNENDYKDYQERLKSYIGQIDMNMPPIIWEFRNWIPTDMFNN